MNILLTSAGRRNYMVEYFREALKESGGSVHVINSTDESAAAVVADHFSLAPPIYDLNYGEFLLKYCLQNQIKIVVPLFDIELPVLSRLKESFAAHEIIVLVGDEWLTKMANDKWETQEFLRQHDFNTVPGYLDIQKCIDSMEIGAVTFPMYVKPRWGMGSIGVFRADDMDELSFFYNYAKKKIKQSYLKYESAFVEEYETVFIQQAMPGDEYGLDIINDLDGNYVTTIVKRKDAMRSGETDIATIVSITELKLLGKKLAEKTKHPGNMDVDVFYDGHNAYILELNPRFGGGYPFSHAAGINLPKAIIGWVTATKNASKWVNNPPLIGRKSLKGICLLVDSTTDSIHGA